MDEDRKIDTNTDGNVMLESACLTVNATWDSNERGDMGKFCDDFFSDMFKYIVGLLVSERWGGDKLTRQFFEVLKRRV
ncbi:MAG: hypothetical protein LBT59_15055 [Clostridiales bacterium]|nr:hypothetical protein [Clostridiales bacterium]